MDILEKIAAILKDYSLHASHLNFLEIPILKNIKNKIENQQELLFVLPAFPAKSPSPDKTSGELPDYGEVLALQNLQDLCDRISAIYPLGAKVVICSDGRVFSDVVNVSDINIDNYNQAIRDIISDYQLNALSLLSMDDLYPSKTPEELRTILFDFYASDIEEIKELVKNSENYRHLFNGIHRFLFEDALALNIHQTRSFINKETKKRAYELLRRSDAWSNLLQEHFFDDLRLSIHPHPINHEKFGIKLVSSSSKWATPWHNVVVKMKNRFELMHRSEAKKLNAVLKMEKEKYVYFEVPAF